MEKRKHSKSCAGKKKGIESTIETIKTYVSRRKSVPGHVSHVKYASSFLVATFIHSLLLVSISLLQSMILVKVHFKLPKCLVSLYASAFSSVNGTPVGYKFPGFSNIVPPASTWRCNLCIVERIAFPCNCVCHLFQVNGRCSREWNPRTRFDVFKWHDVISVDLC